MTFVKGTKKNTLILYTKFKNTHFSFRFDHCSFNKTKDPRKNNHKILIADSDIHNLALEGGGFSLLLQSNDQSTMSNTDDQSSGGQASTLDDIKQLL